VSTGASAPGRENLAREGAAESLLRLAAPGMAGADRAAAALALARVDLTGHGGEGIEELCERLPFAAVAAVLEHLAGVVPLLGLFPADPGGTAERVRQGGLLAALGLFTPNARFSTLASPVQARRAGGGVVLTGRARYACEAARASLVSVDVEGEHRLWLVPHDLAGVTVTGAGRAAGWGWLAVREAVVQEEELSEPVDRASDGRMVGAVDACAWLHARAVAARCARDVRRLRRALAGTGSGCGVLSTSQLVAHELTRLEIEIGLLAAAAGFGPGFADEAPGGARTMAVLCAAANVLHRTARLGEEITTALGVALDQDGHGDEPAAVADADAHFGGRWMVEGELGRRLGLARE
jgi:hypothetical protein